MATTQDQQPKFTYQRRRRSVQFFVEPLNENLGMEPFNQNLGIEMMLIPAGTFMMGSPEDEIDRSSDESPQHEVNVPTFFMGKYSITQAQWRFVAKLPLVSQKLNPDPSRFKGDKRPGEQVSWYEAVEFCDRLSAHTGREYRLPTEAEWEYACRAGTTTPFHFGETITTGLANYRGTDNKEFNLLDFKYREETTPVDHFGIANAFGLCNMHGNVWEWCLDHWHDNYKGAPIDGSAWLTENEKAGRVIRGGSWGSDPRNCRSASRYIYLPVSRYYDLGFRVVCVAPRTL